MKNPYTMTLSADEWTTAELVTCWMDDGTEEITAARLAECEQAYIINHLNETLPGWMYGNGEFCGPHDRDALPKIMDLIVVATDWVIEHMDEIAAEQD